MTAVLSSAIGIAATAWQVGLLRSEAWFARGLRVPARNALLADVVPATAYGFERAMDNLGAIGGPPALALVAAVGIRWAVALAVVPGLLAAAAIVYAIRRASGPAQRERQPLRFHLRPILRGQLGRLMAAVAAFELGNVAATLLILRATQLLTRRTARAWQPRSHSPSMPPTTWRPPLSPFRPAARLIAWVAWSSAGPRRRRDGICLRLPGLRARRRVSRHPDRALPPRRPGHWLRGDCRARCRGRAEPPGLARLAFGLLATIQASGNLAASAIAGVLWSAVSPTAAFLYLAGWTILALLGLLASVRGGRG